MPFPRNPDFVGRDDDLESLHAALQTRQPVGIRPAGLTGMGGIGKTQLVVEYAYRYRQSYPDGIFWVNAVGPLAQGLADIGARLHIELRGESLERQLRVAFEELSRRPDALVIFDNLEDPTQLVRPVEVEGSPSTLACRILFTTRHRTLGRFHTLEISVLPEDPALKLLLRHDSRHAVRDQPNHPQRNDATHICKLLGYLPLALELASAFLAEWPNISLEDYCKRLRDEGCIQTLDSEVQHLSPINFQPIHEAAVAATLRTQWNSLRTGEEAARLLFLVAGHFSEAAAIPVASLGLFAGVSPIGKPGNPSPLRRALKRLHDVRLIEELHDNRIRLHTLIHEFSCHLTSQNEVAEFRLTCARRAINSFADFNVLEQALRADGVDGLQYSLKTARDFDSSTIGDVRTRCQQILRVVRREVHNLRISQDFTNSNYFAQQFNFRAKVLGETSLAESAARRLAELAQPYLLLLWCSHRESSLIRVLTGHRGEVNSVAVAPDGRHVVTGSDDKTAAVWDLQTGARIRVLSGHQGRVFAVAVTPDGRHVVTGSGDKTAAVWDLQTGARTLELVGHRDSVLAVAVTPDGRHVVTGSGDKTAAVWDLQTGAQIRVLRGHRERVLAVAVTPDGKNIVTGSWDKTLAVWLISTGQFLRQFTRHRQGVRAVAVSPDGQHIISGSYDQTVAVWDRYGTNILHEFTGHQHAVRSVAVSPDGKHVITGSQDKTVATWDLRTAERPRDIVGHHGAVRSVAVSPDGKHVITGSQDKTVAIWDLHTGRITNMHKICTFWDCN